MIVMYDKILKEKLCKISELCKTVSKEIDSDKDMYYYYNFQNASELIRELREVEVIGSLITESEELKINLNECEAKQ